MKTITLNTNQQMELENLKKKYQAKHKIYRKLKCIELRFQGVKPKEITKLLDVWNDIICIRCKIFEKEWLQWLCKNRYDWRRVSEFEQYKEEILKMVDENCYSSYKEFYHEIKKKFNIKNKQDALRNFCKKNWIWVLKKQHSSHENVQKKMYNKQWLKRLSR